MQLCSEAEKSKKLTLVNSLLDAGGKTLEQIADLSRRLDPGTAQQQWHHQTHASQNQLKTASPAHNVLLINIISAHRPQHCTWVIIYVTGKKIPHRATLSNVEINLWLTNFDNKSCAQLTPTYAGFWFSVAVQQSLWKKHWICRIRKCRTKSQGWKIKTKIYHLQVSTYFPGLQFGPLYFSRPSCRRLWCLSATCKGFDAFQPHAHRPTACSDTKRWMLYWVWSKYNPVMLVLGIGLGLKAKFCGRGLAIGWPWPWDIGLGLGKKFKAKILADYKIHH